MIKIDRIEYSFATLLYKGGDFLIQLWPFQTFLKQAVIDCVGVSPNASRSIKKGNKSLEFAVSLGK